MNPFCLAGLAIALGACQEPSPPAATAPVTPSPVVEPAASVATPPASASVSPVAALAPASRLSAPATPDAIKPPSGTLVLKAHAKGVQIYACTPKKDAPTELEWTLKAPEATLFDAQGNAIGKHYAGPTWEATDGSKLVGALKAKVDAPTPTAIPWLLVEAKSNAGQGLFGHVAFVQRVDTEAGKAPAQGCDKAHAQAEARVDYAANYYFYDAAH